jgi:ADP-heptose:LPS heptosyltransferase
MEIGEQIILINGGIGDFLQCTPFLLKNIKNPVRYFVVTHFSGAREFFSTLGIHIDRIEYYKTFTEIQEIAKRLSKEGPFLLCPRTLLFDTLPFNALKIEFAHPAKTIGIHLGGSFYSVTHQKAHGLAPKNLPSIIIRNLIPKNFNILLFGSRDEIQSFGIPESDYLRHVCFPEISRSLSFVSSCDAFIGSDSAFKTMSSMSRIPTLVLLADYMDECRDKLFIDPYVSANVMAVFRYNNLDESQNIEAARNIIINFLKLFDCHTEII